MPIPFGEISSARGEMNTSVRNLLHTSLAIPLAVALWILIYALVHFLLTALDLLHGIADNILQIIFREIAAPAAGGYFAIALTENWLSNANMTIVLWVLSVLIFIFFIGLPVTLIIFFLPEGWTFSWIVQINRWAVGAATIIGAIFAYRSIKR